MPQCGVIEVVKQIHSEQREDDLSLLHWVVLLNGVVYIHVPVTRNRSKTRFFDEIVIQILFCFFVVHYRLQSRSGSKG